MYQFRIHFQRRLLQALLLATVIAPVHAADTTTTTETKTDPAVATTSGQATVETRYVGKFSAFAGSDENAQSLYRGLRTGSSITLEGPGTGGTTGTNTVQIDPPTRPMGNGNVYISTALARQQLANYGITDPTPQQLQAALTGGTIQPADPSASPVDLKGILVQRADGMGWGGIAKASGMNLGQVVSGLRSSKFTAMSSGNTNQGVTTAAGTTVQSKVSDHSGHGRSELASSRGMVTAAGGPVQTGGAMFHGGGRSAGAGITTLSGTSGSGRSGMHAQGHGKGLSKN